jgi:nucleotide-binding universal stress UspA family protein
VNGFASKAIKRRGHAALPLRSAERLCLSEDSSPTFEATPYIGGMAPPLLDSIDSLNHEEHGRSLRIVKAAAKKLEKAGLRATPDVFEGDPKEVLVKIAEDWRADCVFIGATGLTNRFERFLLGSTAAAVAARAHCSVEVVRRRRRERKNNGHRN